MRIAHFFSGDPNTGAASGALNLCKGLVKNNTHIEIFNDKFDFNIKEQKIFYKKNYIKNFFSNINNIYDRCSFFSLKKKIKFSNGLIGRLPISIDEINKFDIVHLHWINNGFFNLKYLNKINVPIVWTIRDMWPFTGGCHYTLGCKRFHTECKKCPSIKTLLFKKDIIYNLFKKKSSILDNKKIYVVAISEWIENELRNSFLLKNKNISQIYNCIDDEIFFPENIINARKKLKLPLNKFIILIGSQKLDDKIKNNRKIFNILNDHKFRDCFFISFGKNFKSFKNLKNYGYIKDKNILRQIFSASNLYLSFAKEEAFGKTLAESLMCNTPVVAYDNNSSKEIIDHKKNGYIVNDENYDIAIDWIRRYKNKNEQQINISNTEKFTLREISRQYIELYSKILNEKKNSLLIN